MPGTRFSICAVAAAVMFLAGCGGVRTTRFLNPDFNFGFVERVAVLPFENLANDQQAGVRATRLFATELLATGGVDVVEPGEVRAALSRLPGTGYPLGTEQVIEIGRVLGVQAVVQGSVNESQIVQSGTGGFPVVTLDVHMVEVETGVTVWAATHTEKGTRFGSRFLGTGGEPLSATTRECVRKVIRTLVR